jgi:hypothetical protein
MAGEPGLAARPARLDPAMRIFAAKKVVEAGHGVRQDEAGRNGTIL